MPIRACQILNTRKGVFLRLILSKYNCESPSKTCILPPQELRGVPIWEYTLITIIISLSASPSSLTPSLSAVLDQCSCLMVPCPRRPVMITALGTLVFIHKRQRLRRHQALRDYYFEQMELSHIRMTFTDPFSQSLTWLGSSPSHMFDSLRRSIAALHTAVVDGRLRIKEQ